MLCSLMLCHAFTCILRLEGGLVTLLTYKVGMTECRGVSHLSKAVQLSRCFCCVFADGFALTRLCLNSGPCPWLVCCACRSPLRASAEGEFREQLCDHSTWLIAGCLLLIEVLQISIVETTLLHQTILGVAIEQSTDVHIWLMASCVLARVRCPL